MDGDRAPVAAVRLLWKDDVPHVTETTPPSASAEIGPGRRARRVAAAVAVLAAVASGLWVWSAMRSAVPTDSYAWIAVAWAVCVVSVVCAAWWSARPVSVRGIVSTAMRRIDRVDVGTLLAVVALAAAVRLWNLREYPTVLTGDEGQFAAASQDVVSGLLRNPFGVGWMSHPTMYFFVEAASLKWLGETAVGARAPAAVLGTLTVAVTWLYARARFGRVAAIVAAVALATLPVHLYTSRIALNNVTDGLAAIAVVALVEWALERRSIRIATLAGLALGLAQYGYFGSRALPGVVGLLLLIELLRGRGRPRPGSRLDVIVSWMVLGAAAAAMPLFAYFSRHPDDVAARTRGVSIFRHAGDSSLAAVLAKLHDAVLVPVGLPIDGFYKVSAPFVGWALAVPVVVGLLTATLRPLRPGYGAVAAGYWVMLVAAAMTDGDHIYSNRIGATLPLLALAAGIGVAAIGGLLARVTRAPRPAVLAALAALVAVAAAAIGLGQYFSAPDRFEVYSDTNTEVAFRLATDVASWSPRATVYFAGPPRMSLEGFASVRFLIPEATRISLESPLTAAWAPPALTGPTTFVFLPERAGELAIVQRAFPEGTLVEVPDPWSGGLLYIEWRLPTPTDAPPTNEVPELPGSEI